MKLMTPTADVCCFLYSLLSDRPKRANISHRKMPTYDEHCQFLSAHPYSVWYILSIDAAYIGSIYLTKDDEIGVALIASAQGRGYAAEAVKMLMARNPRKRYLANVAPGNEASHKLFAKFGKIIQSTYEILPKC